MYNGNPNEEQIISFLKDAVENVKNASEPDIQLFGTIKKLYAKNVPFSKRKYVAAYIIKQALSGGRGRFNHERSDRFDKFSKDRNTDRSASRRGNERTEHTDRAERVARVQIDESVASTIFIGIGRNRRVYPRDLVGLLVSVCGLERERIGDIRVLANYSFIQLFTEDSEKVINTLNGYDYRGRKLSVSYSKQKDESSSTEEETSASSSADSSIPENVSNVSHGVVDMSETSKIEEEQTAFAQQQAAVQQVKVSSGESGVDLQPYSETADDGQVKSHFGTGAAY